MSFQLRKINSVTTEIFNKKKELYKSDFIRSMGDLMKSFVVFKRWGFLFAPNPPQYFKKIEIYGGNKNERNLLYNNFSKIEIERSWRFIHGISLKRENRLLIRDFANYICKQARVSSCLLKVTLECVKFKGMKFQECKNQTMNYEIDR